MGVGKSSVAEAVHSLLVASAIPHGAVDLDWLWSGYWTAGPSTMEMACSNLRVVWKNYRAVGATHLVIAGVVESEADARRYGDAAELTSLSVCRLSAQPEAIEARLRGRNSGNALEWHLARARELQELMEERSIGDLVIETDSKDHEMIAREVLAGVGWL